MTFVTKFCLGLLCSYLILFFSNPLVRSQPTPPLLTGIYTPGFVGDSSVLRRQVQAVDAFSQKHSLVGMFIDLEAKNPDYDIVTSLNQLQDNGYTGFINFTSQRTAQEIAAGKTDRAIQRMARAYKTWATELDNPITFVAPLPEMNGAWESYGSTPEQFKQAYRHIQTIFAQTGIPAGTIRWVFAPNGWSDQGHEFERYYPGDSVTDIVAFSAYNWGHCHNASWQEWQSPEVVFGPYIDRIDQMAPGKPIFIAQTATTSITQSGANAQAKDNWLGQAYRYLQQTGVRGVIYFNIHKECDWAVYSHQGASVGYQQALNSPGIAYQSPETLATQF